VPDSCEARRLYRPQKRQPPRFGVSSPTLYAYVSRGLIRSQCVAGSRNSRYWKDIDPSQGPALLHEQQDQVGSSEETKGGSRNTSPC